ncbi:MAG: MaoC family dehydratase [Pseudomonadota bacterium]
MKKGFERLEIGEAFSPITKRITQETINRYADASSDYNPIHVDEAFAKETPFKGTIAHGLMSVAFISELMTREFSQGWFTGGKVDMRFRAPIRPGDTITIKGKVTERSSEEGKNLVVCDLVCENQKGDAVIVATTWARC